MKVQQLCVACCVVTVGLFSSAGVGAQELPWEKKLPFENATIHYSINGVEQGEEILYIRNYGKEQATYSDSTTKIMGRAVNEKSVEFVDPDYVYTYDLQTREGMRSVNPSKYIAEAYAGLSAEERETVEKNAKEMGGAMTQGLGGNLQEKAATILGYDCDKVDIMGGGATYLIHGTGIPLKTEINMMGMKMITSAISIDTGRVDPKFFVHPEGIVAEVNTEQDAMAQAMGQRVINALKDPEAAKKGGIGAIQGVEMPHDMTEEDKMMIEQAGELLKGMQGIFGGEN